MLQLLLFKFNAIMLLCDYISLNAINLHFATATMFYSNEIGSRKGSLWGEM